MTTHRIDPSLAYVPPDRFKTVIENGFVAFKPVDTKPARREINPTLLVFLLSVLAGGVAAFVPQVDLSPPGVEQPSGESLAQARIEGWRAGVRHAQEQGCVFPVALSFPLGEQR